MDRQPGVRTWLVLAACAAMAQQALTTYPNPQDGAGVLWTAVSVVLLWLVYRRSNAARLLFAVLGAFGLVVFALLAFDNPTNVSALRAVLYGLQVVAMVVAPVRAWTRTKAPSRTVAAVD